MSAKAFSIVAACLFSLMALAQVTRAVEQLTVTVGDFAIPVPVSWGASAVLVVLAVLGFTAKRG